jgi:hypothetical protein
MKKTIVLSLVTLATTFANAQSLKLEKGKSYKLEAKADMEMNMGLPMNMKTESYVDVTAIKEDDKSYTVVLKKTRMLINQSVMGQEQSIDTDSSAEQEGLEDLKKSLAILDTFLVDKQTGKDTKISQSKSEAEDSSDPMSVLTKQGNGIGELFMVIPKGKKVGDSWTEEISKDGNKVTKTFTYKSLIGDDATIEISSEGKINMMQQINGQDIALDMAIKGKQTLIVNTKTAIMKGAEGSMDTDGTMEFSGQSMPVTMTGKTSAIVK